MGGEYDDADLRRTGRLAGRYISVRRPNGGVSRLDRRYRQAAFHYLYHPWASRPFLRVKASARSLSFGPRGCIAAGGGEHAKSTRTRFC
jgi:hypothetical protein